MVRNDAFSSNLIQQNLLWQVNLSQSSFDDSPRAFEVVKRFSSHELWRASREKSQQFASPKKAPQTSERVQLTIRARIKINVWCLRLNSMIINSGSFHYPKCARQCYSCCGSQHFLTTKLSHKFITFQVQSWWASARCSSRYRTLLANLIRAFCWTTRPTTTSVA